MANASIQTLTLPQATIRVEIDYFDAAEKEKLLNYPTSPEIQALVANGIDIPTEEFLTYYFFHRKRPGKPGWQDYNQVAQQIGRALNYLGDWIDFNGTSISCPGDIGHQERDITEHVGEGISLSVISRLHGLTAIDWDRIPEHRGRNAIRTFDYQIASDGRRVVQLEAKGSATTDNTVLTSAARNHRQDIADKKAHIIQNQNYPYPAGLRYGTVTVLGQRSDVPVRCLLVDPEPEEDEARARKLRVLQRARFIRDWIRFISPRSQLASALSTRLASLEVLADPFQLSGVPLRKGNGEQFDFSPQTVIPFGHSSFFANKSRITDGPAGGVTVQLTDNNLFFLGVREELLGLAANQQLETIMEFRAPRASIQKTVECVFSEGRFRSLRLPESLRQQSVQQGGYYSLRLPGLIHYSDSGILFGVLPVRQ